MLYWLIGLLAEAQIGIQPISRYAARLIGLLAYWLKQIITPPGSQVNVYIYIYVGVCVINLGDAVLERL